MQKGNLFSIGWIERLKGCRIGSCELLFFKIWSIKEGLLFFLYERWLVYIPKSTTLCSIYNRTTIGAKWHIALLFRSIGNTTGCAIFNRSYKHIATNNKSYLFAIGRHIHLIYSGSEVDIFQFVFLIVSYNLDGNFSGFILLLHGIYFTIISKRKCSIVTNWKEPYWIIFKIGQFGCLCIIQSSFVYIERSILLT